MIKIDNELEVIALAKMLNFIKFDCSDDDCLLFAASPYINSIYKKTHSEIVKIYKEKGRSFPDNCENIENYPQYIESIKKNVFRTKNWKELEEKKKKQYVEELIKPYGISQKVVEDIIVEGDLHHTQNHSSHASS